MISYSLTSDMNYRARTERGNWVIWPDGSSFIWTYAGRGEMFLSNEGLADPNRFEIVISVQRGSFIEWDPDGSLRVDGKMVAPGEITRISDPVARRIAWDAWKEAKT